MNFLLLMMLAVPAGGAIIVALMGRQRRCILWTALAVTIADLVLASVVACNFMSIPRETAKTFSPEMETNWRLLDVGNVGSIRFHIGIDGLNIWLIVLTALLMVSAVLISWKSIQERTNEFFAWLLVLGTGMIGVFLAFDIILFYVFFELTLVPLFFLIGIWGGPQRRYAARKFFIYTLAGSLITLLGLLAVVAACYERPIDDGTARTLTFSIPELVRIVNLPEMRAYWQPIQVWIFFALVVGFAIKVPLVPAHTWLPLAHVEAPTAGSVLLAGVLLKIGSYGFLRLCIPLTPDACMSIGVPLIGTLAVIGILYGALCALAQDDIKKLVAYSSVSHLGFCMLGMFALNTAGLTGSLMQMINHGLSTGALFLLVGMLYDRFHTRRISDFGGIGAKLGCLTVCMVFMCLSSIGLPGLNGFVGESLVFFGMITVRPDLAIIGTLGILLGAWYLMSLLRRMFFGPLKEPKHFDDEPITDLKLREAVALGPIMVLCVVLGVYPKPVLDSVKPDMEIIANILKQRK